MNNLVDMLVMYKIKHYNNNDYDNNGVLINCYSIRHNYDFAKFVYIENIKHLKDDSKKKYLYKNKIEQLGFLVEIKYDILKEYLEIF